MSTTLQKVDHSALRTNQAIIISLSIIAFVLNWAWLAALVMLVMIYGTLRRQPGFRLVYSGLLQPRGWVKPDVIDDFRDAAGPDQARVGLRGNK